MSEAVFDEVPLAAACRLITDGSHFSPTPQEDGFPIVNAKDIPSGRVELETCTRISKREWLLLKSQNCAPIPGDVLLSKDGTIGRVVHYKEELGVVLLSSVAIIRPDETLDPGFLAQALRSHIFDQQVFSLQSGSALRRLILADIKKIKVPRPSLPAQCRIAEILSTLDEAIEQTEALVAKMQQVKAGLMQDLFTCGVTPDGHLRPTRDQAPYLYKESALGWIPKEWEVVELNNEIGIAHGFAFSGEFFSDAPPGEVLLTPGNFHRDGGLYFTVENTKYFQGSIPPTTILQNGEMVTVMTDLSPQTLILGRFAIVEMPFPLLHNQRIGRVMLKRKDRWDWRYLCYALNDERVRRKIIVEATGTTVRHTSPSRILGNRVARPHLDEQLRSIDVLLSIERRLLEEHASHLKCTQQKHGLMHDLLTGRVEV